jgi:hypothetical protein
MILKSAKKKIALLLPIIVIAGSLALAGAAFAQYWVTDPADCPTTYSGQNCTPDNVCGLNGTTAQCYDTESMNPPGVTAVSNNSYHTTWNNGGYVIDCYDSPLDGGSPFCDNDANWWCDRNYSCSCIRRTLFKKY